MRRVPYILAALVLVASALILAGRYWFTGSAYELPALTGKFERHAFSSGGIERRFGYYVPRRLAADAPLLFVLHGSAADGVRMRAATAYAFDALADRDGFIAVYPDGYEGHWNDCRRHGDYSARREYIDDIGFFRDMVAWFGRQWPVAKRPVFVVGLSNGGHMAFRLGLEAPALIDAAVAIAANLPAPSNLDCEPSGRSVPMLLIEGTADPISPYGGGEVAMFGVLARRGEVLGAEASARYWATVAGYTSEPFRHRFPDTRPEDGSVADRMVWTAPGRPEVALITLHGGGHTIPHPAYRMPRILGGTNQDIAAAAEAWRFCRRQAPVPTAE